jgi:hypothetical protein
LNNIVNFDVLTEPLNWVIVFLVLYFLALISHYVATQLNAVGVTFL